MGKWFILDPGLIRRGGHNYQMAARMGEGLRAADGDVRILANVDVEPEITSTLGARGVFSQSHYTLLSQDPCSGVLEDFATGSRRFAVEAAKAGAAPRADDVVVLPTAGPRELYGLAQFLRSRRARPRVAAIFHRVEPPRAPFARGEIGSAITRMAVKAIVGAVGRQRFLLGATNDVLAQKLSEPAGIPVITLPVPAWYPALEAPVSAAAPGKPWVVFLGHMRENHGFQVVPALVRAIAERHPEVQCCVHLGAVAEHFDLGPYRALQSEGKAEVVEGWLDDEAMAGLFRKAALLVMPYDRASYREMVSAVFSTAVAMGRPCVVPSGTWLSDQVEARRGSGTIYEGGASVGVPGAVDRALGELETLSASARQRALSWRANQSGEKLLERLVAWAGSAPAGTAPVGRRNPR